MKKWLDNSIYEVTRFQFNELRWPKSTLDAYSQTIMQKI